MRVPLLAVLLLASLFAGCADEADPEPVPLAPAVLTPPSFAAPVALPQAVGAAEPNIAILPDGTLFVTAPVGGSLKPNVNEGAAYLWRSTDDGATWEVVRSPHVGPSDQLPLQPGGGFCSCDADVVASPDGWVYYSDWWISGVAPGNYMVEASGDSGETWTSTPVTIPQDLVASIDRQWLVAGDDGFVGLFYSFYAPSPAPVGVPAPVFGLDRQGQAILASFSNDHGASWSDPVTVVPAADGDGYQIAHPFLAPNGTLMMAYGRVADIDSFWLDPSEVRLAWSTDQGDTWQDRLLADVPLGFDNLWAVQGTVDPSTGQVTVVWAARLDGVKGGDVAATSRMALYVLQFGPLGTLGPLVVRGDGTNFLPWAAARDGQVAVGWYGGNGTGDVTAAGTDEEWFTYVAVAAGGWFDGNHTVSRVSDEPVKVGPICPKGAACGGDRELLDYVSLVFDDEGRLHYAFARSQVVTSPTNGPSSDAFVHVANQLP